MLGGYWYSIGGNCSEKFSSGFNATLGLLAIYFVLLFIYLIGFIGFLCYIKNHEVPQPKLPENLEDKQNNPPLPADNTAGYGNFDPAYNNGLNNPGPNNPYNSGPNNPYNPRPNNPYNSGLNNPYNSGLNNPYNPGFNNPGYNDPGLMTGPNSYQQYPDNNYSNNPQYWQYSDNQFPNRPQYQDNFQYSNNGPNYQQNP